MSSMTKKTYRQLQDELSDVLDSLQSKELDIDEAFKQFEKGEKLLGALELQLKSAENKLKKINQ